MTQTKPDEEPQYQILRLDQDEIALLILVAMSGHAPPAGTDPTRALEALPPHIATQYRRAADAAAQHFARVLIDAGIGTEMHAIPKHEHGPQ